MNPQIPATEFEVCVSMIDLVVWPDQMEKPSAQHPALQAIFDAFGAKINLLPIVNAYFDDIARAGRGDVHVFQFDDDRNSTVAIDCYSEPTDQLDLVVLYIRCDSTRRVQISELVRQFFNAASVQVHSSQASICAGLRDAIDSSKFPRAVGEGVFLQSQVVHHAV